MAYIGQEKKKAVAAELKAALKGTGIKYTLGIHHHSTLVIKIWEGPVDFIENYWVTTQNDWKTAEYRQEHKVEKPNYLDINEYWFQDHFTGKALEILTTIKRIMMKGNHDNSDPMTDYFDVGWYIDIKIGTWEKPYTVTGVLAPAEEPKKVWTKEELTRNTLMALMLNEHVVKTLEANDPKMLEQLKDAAAAVEPEFVEFIKQEVGA